ncbi:MAG: cell division protein FtsQ/DivIB [Holosporales bacterium]|jgi:cell division protein FtsQ|nr:cell division protein FtsQ/DivIB [Holosporales bacterium]
MADTFLRYLDDALKIAGFTVKTFDIHVMREMPGHSDRTMLIPCDSARLLSFLGMSRRDSIFKLSSQQIYENIMMDTTIRSAKVRKKLPNIIDITIFYKIPIAIFQQDSKLMLIDDRGTFIKDVTGNPPDYPLIVGKGANITAKAILDIISRYGEIRKNLRSLAFIRERRWNIEVAGLKVKLPEDGVEEALETLRILMRQPNINRKTTKCIDLRIAGSVIINGLKVSKKTRKGAMV